MEMESADVYSSRGVGGIIFLENSTSETTPTFFNRTSTIRPHNPEEMYQFDGSSVVVILYFIIIQASIWAFFIFCYFARKGRSPIMRSSNESGSSPPSVSSDMPPDYASSVNPTDYPPFVEVVLDEKPPDYDKVIAGFVTNAPAKR